MYTFCYDTLAFIATCIELHMYIPAYLHVLISKANLLLEKLQYRSSVKLVKINAYTLTVSYYYSRNVFKDINLILT